MTVLDFRQGDIIITEGDSDERLFMLQSGIVEVLKSNVRVAFVDEPNTIIGELSSILGKPRSCTVRAVTDSTLIEVGANVAQIIERSPIFTRSILQELASRLEATTARLAEANNQLLTFRHSEDASGFQRSPK